MTTICDKDHKEEISIHAPHEGERRYDMQGNIGQLGFQSTLPTRGSDMERGGWKTDSTIFQSTLPTRGSDKAEGVFGAT